jgi:hypothetical protein
MHAGSGNARYTQSRGRTIRGDIHGRPDTLRTYAALFEKMLPSDATCAAARALRFMADEIERRIVIAKPSADHQANALNGAASQS